MALRGGSSCEDGLTPPLHRMCGNEAPVLGLIDSHSKARTQAIQLSDGEHGREEKDGSCPCLLYVRRSLLYLALLCTHCVKVDHDVPRQRRLPPTLLINGDNEAQSQSTLRWGTRTGHLNSPNDS
ncbi:hypothetical protein HGRIS_001471 [Hohenbuehelia grisea]|uniref:Uncharacterized protein n=1 Tax=Hohenbuehelia grisea TaxID=104357 RepID=A0ABR3JQG1_9AGAR